MFHVYPIHDPRRHHHCLGMMASCNESQGEVVMMMTRMMMRTCGFYRRTEANRLLRIEARDHEW